MAKHGARGVTKGPAPKNNKPETDKPSDNDLHAKQPRQSARLSVLEKLVKGKVAEAATKKTTKKAPTKSVGVAGTANSATNATSKSSKPKAAVKQQTAKTKPVPAPVNSENELENEPPVPSKKRGAAKKKGGLNVKTVNAQVPKRAARAPDMDESEEEVIATSESESKGREDDEDEDPESEADSVKDDRPYHPTERTEDVTDAATGVSDEGAVWTAKRKLQPHHAVNIVEDGAVVGLPSRLHRKQHNSSAVQHLDSVHSPVPIEIDSDINDPASNVGDDDDDSHSLYRDDGASMDMDVDEILDFAMSVDLDDDNEKLIKKHTTLKRKKTGQLKGNPAQKLRTELPQVSNMSLPTSRTAKPLRQKTVIPQPAANSQAPASSATQQLPTSTVMPQPPTSVDVPAPLNLATPQGNWLVHTNISVCPRGHSFILQGKKQQSMQINALFDRAFIIGHAQIIFYTSPCPFSVDGMEQISWNALVQAANELHYDGVHDIGERLKLDVANQYGSPLKNYTIQRLTDFRGHFKRPAASLIPVNLNLNVSPQGRADAALLLNDMAYIYGKKVDGTPNFRQPFKAPVILTYLQRVVFLSTGALHKVIKVNFNKLTSSSDNPLELEIPPSMLAFAATSIHNLIMEHVRGVAVAFSADEMSGVYNNHIETIAEIRSSNPVAYHSLMHSLYRDASGTLPLATHGLTTEAIIQRGNWDTELDL